MFCYITLQHLQFQHQICEKLNTLKKNCQKSDSSTHAFDVWTLQRSRGWGFSRWRPQKNVMCKAGTYLGETCCCVTVCSSAFWELELSDSGLELASLVAKNVALWTIGTNGKIKNTFRCCDSSLEPSASATVTLWRNRSLRNSSGGRGNFSTVQNTLKNLRHTVTHRLQKTVVLMENVFKK